MDWYSVDFNNTVSALVEAICKKRGVSSKFSKDYGLFFPPSSSTTTSYRQSRYWTLTYGNGESILWLDNTKKLSSYPLSDGERLMFGVVPYRAKVLTYNDDNPRECLVNIYDRVSDVLSILCTRFSLGDPSALSLAVILPDESDASSSSSTVRPPIAHPLWPWGTLKEQITSSLDHKDCLTLQILHQTPETERLEKSNHIWSDPYYCVGVSQTLQNEPLQSGTLNRLVIELTSEREFFDLSYVSTFFYTYRSFTSPEQLLQKLSQRYFDIPPTFSSSLRMLIQMRVCTALKHWVDIEYDDLTTSMINKICSFIESISITCSDSPEDKKIRGVIDRLKRSISGISHKRKEARNYKFLEKAPNSIIPKHMLFSKRPVSSIYDMHETEIARQLTLISFSAFSHIKTTELYKSNWTSPNVSFLIDFFNKISAWVATSIVLDPKLSSRAKLMEKHILVAKKLREINSFHMLTAYISGITNSAVSRLKWTKSKIAKHLQQVLEELTDTTSMEGSFRKYRQSLATANPPCIPYLGVCLMDLTFIEDGNPDFVESNHINFAKRRLVYDSVLSPILKCQATGYNYQTVEEIQNFFLSSNLLIKDEKAMYHHSLFIEPRNAERSVIS
eukprot:TRINITY_DN5370_c0_g3_i2.p1 TRINITY_DN5370_c0_g3~~TRINITY_DN5370_c0_g3_i2.p1  ORF type:complete len:662 (-),score=102.47 TRINITY_DN5370_c0_g3_i2:1464-3314(-)